ncbi:LacI family transcriptional regulator [Cupriavidus basilensis OR16]|uniref:LacI family transcriptional regulator n=1 Tax=Cupriavidus basilensis OR16 TaxID=1127483 RepID=H1SA18_9BURK|nr:LacI family transcriptional regulator [Cupriavidus basilensis OR16]
MASSRKPTAPRTAPAPAPAGRATGSVTLADVAKIAGVSPITVSRVVNQPGLVSAGTVARVQEAIQRTGYVPNLLAGGLASRRSRLIAAIVPTIANSIFADTIQALTDRFSQAGYQMMLGLSGYAATREQDLLAAILSRRPDGIVLTGIAHTADTRRRLLAARVPVVETWDITPTPIDMLVGFSHEKVGQTVAEFLHARGYRKPAILSASDQRAESRRLGFLDAFGRHGITEVPSSIVPAPSSLGLGREGLARLLDGGARPDVVFCSSDTLAQGALSEARARGLKVPEQLAVMGFGDGLGCGPAARCRTRYDCATIQRFILSSPRIHVPSHAYPDRPARAADQFPPARAVPGRSALGAGRAAGVAARARAAGARGGHIRPSRHHRRGHRGHAEAHSHRELRRGL